MSGRTVRKTNLAQRRLLLLDGWGSGFPARGVSSREHVANTEEAFHLRPPLQCLLDRI